MDATVRAQILALLDNLRRGPGLAYILVSHDLAVVRLIAGTVSVMRAGRVVEAGPVEEVFRAATTPYGRELIDPIPGRPAPCASGGGEAARPGSSGRRPAP